MQQDTPEPAAAPETEPSGPRSDSERPDVRFVGEICGAYRLLETIGRGGMGVVYRAIPLDPDQPQAVAIKRLLGTHLDERAIERFRRERRALSRLDHPAIARLFDGGTDGQGTPFLVMELVVGMALTTHADQALLSVDRRLTLFGEVCEAVEAAHRALVVHRDLKPSNILVNAAGKPKLLDFGIAKLIDSTDERAAPTREGLPALTPEYASPEQLRGEPVGTPSDVFSLGVVLCELLTGRRPWKGGVDRWRTPDAEALPPSHLLNDPETAESIARERATSAAPLRRQLAGDLGAILRRALELEPERRYLSVAALREDLERLRSGQPVAARPLSLAYRTWKFLRRNRVAAATVTALLTTLVGGAATTAWQASRARQQATRAEAVSNFLVQLFEHADPDADRGPALPVGDVLTEGRLRVASELATDPGTRAQLQATLARVYRSLGQFALAEQLAGEALAAYATAGEQSSAAAGRTRLDLVGIAIDRGDQTTASAQLASFQTSLRGNETASLRSERLALEASLAADRGEADQALKLQEEALATARAIGNDDETRRRLLELSDLLRATQAQGNMQKQLDEADRLLREALSATPAGTRLAGDLLDSLGANLHQSSRYAEALTTLQEAADLRTGLLGAAHPDTLSTLSAIANTLNLQGELAKAAELFSAVGSRQRETLGPRHPKLAVTLNNQGLVEYNLGNFRDALEDFGEAASIWETTLGPDHEWAFAARANEAASAADLGEWALAEVQLRQLLARHETHFGPAARPLVGPLNSLGILRRRMGRPAESLALHQRASAINLAQLGPDHDATLGSSIFECLARLDLGDGPSVATVVERMSAALARSRSSLAWSALANLQVTLGRALVRQGRLAEALPLLEASLAARETQHSRPHWRTAEARLAVAALRVAQGRNDLARGLRQVARQELVAALGAGHPLIAYLEKTVR